MAFNINAHVILQGPKNISAVTKSIRSQLQNINVNVGLNIPNNVQSQLTNLNNQLNNANKNSQKFANTAKTTSTSVKNMANSTKGAANAMQVLGKETALTFKRFAAAGIVTATFFRLTQAISEAVPKALEFERGLVKLQQITGSTAKGLGNLKNSVSSLSQQFGKDANELLELAQIFAQTGQSIRQVEASVRAVARSSLAPTFGDMKQTAEGLVAALNQFGIAASDSEKVLGSLNRVSKKFAVESDDLIAAIRRAGGVFAISAGQFKEPIEALNEFSAIFTAVRSTTRETAETVATGLRTIFSRIQRRGTIDVLKGLGIELTDTQGKFVGLFESFRRLSAGLDQLVQKGDAITLSAITEELGGIRQIGKLIPAIKNFNKAERAFAEAQRGAVEGLGSDVAKGLTPLIVQFEKVRERFNALIRTISESSTFRALSKTAIGLANAFLGVAESLTPILPILAKIAAFKLTRGAFSFFQGFFGSARAGGGAGGAGAALGSAITGGGGGGRGGAGGNAATNALATAVKSMNTAVTKLSGATANNTTATNNLTQQIRDLQGVIVALTNAIKTRGFGGGATPIVRRGGRGGRGAGRRGIMGFASGGLVPGTGDRDTVPAMLTPGEFVLRKSAVKAIGASNLKGYNKGGRVVGRVKPTTPIGLGLLSAGNPPDFISATLSGIEDKDHKSGAKLRAEFVRQAKAFEARTGAPLTARSAAFSQSELDRIKELRDGSEVTQVLGKRDAELAEKIANRAKRKGKAGKVDGRSISKSALTKGRGGIRGAALMEAIALAEQNPGEEVIDYNMLKAQQGKIQALNTSIYGISTNAKQAFGNELIDPLPDMISKATAALGDDMKFPAFTQLERVLDGGAVNSLKGILFEAVIKQASQVLRAEGETEAGIRFDIPAGDTAQLSKIFGPQFVLPTELKNELGKTQRNSFLGKAISGVPGQVIFDLEDLATFNKGGAVFGSGNTPALLTPGEYVFDKKTAQGIGYGNLNALNAYAEGGIVTPSRNFYGNPAAGRLQSTYTQIYQRAVSQGVNPRTAAAQANKWLRSQPGAKGVLSASTAAKNARKKIATKGLPRSLSAASLTADDILGPQKSKAPVSAATVSRRKTARAGRSVRIRSGAASFGAGSVLDDRFTKGRRPKRTGPFKPGPMSPLVMTSSRPTGSPLASRVAKNRQMRTAMALRNTEPDVSPKFVKPDRPKPQPLPSKPTPPNNLNIGVGNRGGGITTSRPQPIPSPPVNRRHAFAQQTLANARNQAAQKPLPRPTAPPPNKGPNAAQQARLNQQRLRAGTQGGFLQDHQKRVRFDKAKQSLAAKPARTNRGGAGGMGGMKGMGFAMIGMELAMTGPMLIDAMSDTAAGVEEKGQAMTSALMSIGTSLLFAAPMFMGMGGGGGGPKKASTGTRQRGIFRKNLSRGKGLGTSLSRAGAGSKMAGVRGMAMGGTGFGMAALGPAIAGAVGVALAGPISEFATGTQNLEKIGAQQIKGSRLESGQTARERGAIKGAVAGGSAGAALGFILGGPVGAAIGGGIGVFAGKAIGQANAAADKIRFDAIAGLNDASKEAGEALHKLANDAFVTADDIDKANRKNVEMFNRLSSAGGDFEQARGVGFMGGDAERASFMRVGEGLSGFLGLFTGSFLRGGGGVGDIESGSQRELLQRAGSKDPVMDFFSRAGLSFDSQEKSQREIDQDVAAGELVVEGRGFAEALKNFDPKIAEQSAAALANALGNVTNTIILASDDSKGKIEELQGFLSKIDASDPKKAQKNFTEIQKALDLGLLGEAGKKAAATIRIDLGNQLFAATQGAIEKLGKQDAAALSGAIKRVQQAAASGDMDAFNQALLDGNRVLGQAGPAYSGVQRQFNRLTQEAMANSVALTEQSISQAVVNNLLEATGKVMDGMVTALQKLTNAMEQTLNSFDVFVSNAEKRVGSLLSGEADFSLDEVVNPFENLDIQGLEQGGVTDAIRAGFAEIESVGGAGASGTLEGLEGVPGFAAALPDVLKDSLNAITEDVSARGGELGTNQQMLDTIRERAEAAGAEGPVLDAFMKQMEATLTQARQGEGGIDAIKAALGNTGDIVEQFGGATQEIIDQLSAQFDAARQIAQRSADIAKLQRDVQLKLRDFDKKRDDIDKRVGEITGSRKGGLAEAQADLNQNIARQTGQAVSIGGRVVAGGVATANVGELQARQTSLQQEKARIEAQLAQPGQGTNTELIGQLATVKGALEDTTGALSTLADDTTRLAAIESEIADLQSKQLAEQDSLKGTFERLQGIQEKINRGDFKGAAEDRKAIRDDFRAVELLETGGQLTTGQMSKLLSGQLDPILTAGGKTQEEIAKLKTQASVQARGVAIQGLGQLGINAQGFFAGVDQGAAIDRKKEEAAAIGQQQKDALNVMEDRVRKQAVTEMDRLNTAVDNLRIQMQLAAFSAEELRKADNVEKRDLSEFMGTEVNDMLARGGTAREVTLAGNRGTAAFGNFGASFAGADLSDQKVRDKIDTGISGELERLDELKNLVTSTSDFNAIEKEEKRLLGIRAKLASTQKDAIKAQEEAYEADRKAAKDRARANIEAENERLKATRGGRPLGDAESIASGNLFTTAPVAGPTRGGKPRTREEMIADISNLTPEDLSDMLDVPGAGDTIFPGTATKPAPKELATLEEKLKTMPAKALKSLEDPQNAAMLKELGFGTGGSAPSIGSLALPIAPTIEPAAVKKSLNDLGVQTEGMFKESTEKGIKNVDPFAMEAASDAFPDPFTDKDGKLKEQFDPTKSPSEAVRVRHDIEQRVKDKIERDEARKKLAQADSTIIAGEANTAAYRDRASRDKRRGQLQSMRDAGTASSLDLEELDHLQNIATSDIHLDNLNKTRGKVSEFAKSRGISLKGSDEDIFRRLSAAGPEGQGLSDKLRQDLATHRSYIEKAKGSTVSLTGAAGFGEEAAGRLRNKDGGTTGELETYRTTTFAASVSGRRKAMLEQAKKDKAEAEARLAQPELTSQLADTGPQYKSTYKGRANENETEMERRIRLNKELKMGVGRRDTSRFTISNSKLRLADAIKAGEFEGTGLLTDASGAGASKAERRMGNAAYEAQGLIPQGKIRSFKGYDPDKIGFDVLKKDSYLSSRLTNQEVSTAIEFRRQQQLKSGQIDPMTGALTDKGKQAQGRYSDKATLQNTQERLLGKRERINQARNMLRSGQLKKDQVQEYIKTGMMPGQKAQGQIMGTEGAMSQVDQFGNPVTDPFGGFGKQPFDVTGGKTPGRVGSSYVDPKREKLKQQMMESAASMSHYAPEGAFIKKPQAPALDAAAGGQAPIVGPEAVTAMSSLSTAFASIKDGVKIQAVDVRLDQGNILEAIKTVVADSVAAKLAEMPGIGSSQPTNSTLDSPSPAPQQPSFR